MTEETTEEKNGAYYQPSQRPSESDRPQTAPASSPAATAFSNALSGVRISPYGIGVAALVLAYGTLFSWLSILKYQSGHSYIWDLGIFDQVIWNTAQGHFFETSIYGHGSYLGEHLSLILSAFAPLYIVWSDVRLLLVVQSFYMAAGAVPIYLLARRNLRSGTGALLLAVSFLLFPNIAYVNLFDFHPETLLVVLFPWAIYFLHEGRDRPFLIAAGLSLLVKEDVALLVFALGLYAAFVKSRRCMGIGLAVLGLAWFAAAIYLVVPYFRGQGYGFLDRYSHLGSSATEIVFNLVLSPMSTMRLLFAPEKLHYLSQLLSPVAFLPLISPTLAGIGLPILVGNLLSNFPLQYSIFHQYSISLGPIFFASSVTAITRLSSWAKGFLCPE
ncbi:MAG: DUF2079 domain-containing protein, partial [Dehalococcoidia bacterium]|nr:DUF2079 domain-containing protein [Dehalococcoidia bacterium]